MIQHPGIWTNFCQTQQEEVEFIWNKGVIKNKNKVKHLVQKWKPTKTQVTRIWRGILIGDAELEEMRNKLEMEEQKEVPVYGGVEIFDKMKELLKLPPNMTMFETLEDIKFNEELEAMMIKQRWEDKS